MGQDNQTSRKELEGTQIIRQDSRSEVAMQHRSDRLGTKDDKETSAQVHHRQKRLTFDSSGGATTKDLAGLKIVK